jgi:hypothetical protein
MENPSLRLWLSWKKVTLEFDDKGVVIDVLYNENGRHDGLTAMQV